MHAFLRTTIHRLVSPICWLLLLMWLVPVHGQAPKKPAENELEGTWKAVKAERDGKPVVDVVDHQLSIVGNRFEIRAKDGQLLYAGTVRVDPKAKPAAIDFEHAEGAVRGKTWKGIYSRTGETLVICDNAPNREKDRPAAFVAGSGSGYVLVTFKGVKN
jgi:uncharacterized protein (TIGR03067 family)